MKRRHSKEEETSARLEDALHARVVGQLVAQLRMERGVRQDSLAEALTVSQSRISCLEMGNWTADALTLVRIARVLKVDLRHLAQWSREAAEAACKAASAVYEEEVSEERCGQLPYASSLCAFAAAAVLRSQCLTGPRRG